jgi:hypothetical protein
MCNVGALGALAAFAANYEVQLFGRRVNAADVFTESFLSTRTEGSVQRLATYISDGSGRVNPDGSLVVTQNGGTFNVAPAGSVNYGFVQSARPTMAATVSPAVPVNAASPANRVATVLESITPTAPAGQPPSLTQTVIGAALQAFSIREETRAAAAASRSSVLNPPTAPAQGSAANTTAQFGPGSDLRAGTVFNEAGQALPSGPLLSGGVPAVNYAALGGIPALPVAPPPANLSLPVTGAVIQPPQIQSLSPSTGLPTPVFPGIPATSETGDGKVQLNAASLAALMDATAKGSTPPAAPFWTQPMVILPLVAVLGAAFIYSRRRRRR